MISIARLLAEFLGTFTLSFAGIAAICHDAGLLAVASAHGLALVVMISALGAVSGGHFNPAVTAGLFVGGKIPGSDSAQYVLAQLLGSFVAALVIKGVIPPVSVEAAKLGTPMLAATTSAGTGVLVEAILTFFLVTAVYGTAVDPRAPKLGGLIIGLTVTLDILAGGPITGASMNPARSFGPALAGGYWDMHWVYWVGPLLGGAAAGVVWTRIFARNS